MTQAATNVSDESGGLRNKARQFAAEVVRPAALALDRLRDPKEGIAPDSPLWVALRGAYVLQYHAAEMPTELGGLGVGGAPLAVLLEELGWGSAGLASGLLSSSIAFTSAVRAEDPELLKSFARPFADDRSASMVGCWAMSEPHHGSDVLSIGGPDFRHPQTAGDLYGPFGKQCLCVERTQVDIGRERDDRDSCPYPCHSRIKGHGFSRYSSHPVGLAWRFEGEISRKIGQRELNQGEIIFDNVRVRIV
jgi:hypothetical protein